MKLYFVTSNPHKIRAAKTILNNIEIQSISFDLPEIQDTSLNVAIKKAEDAFSKIKEPLIVLDSAFQIKTLNNFPDAYASYVEHTLKEDGILKLMAGVTDRRASYIDTLVYIDKYGYQVFTDEIKGVIALQKLENDAEPYDNIFINNKSKYPVSYYDKKGDKLYINNTYKKLKSFLEKRQSARGITFFQDKVLLLKRRRRDKDTILEYYAIPGGGREEGETLEDAAIRELKEETSINVQIDKYLRREEYDKGVCYYYLTTYQDGEIKLGGEEKEQNNPDNYYEIALVDIKEVENLKIYGIGVEMILEAYKIYQNK